MCANDPNPDRKEMPPMVKAPEVWQWMRGDAYMMGTRAKDYRGQPFFADKGTVWVHGFLGGSLPPDDEEEEMILMKHSHTGELEWVLESDMMPYPSSPIPTP